MEAEEVSCSRRMRSAEKSACGRRMQSAVAMAVEVVEEKWRWKGLVTPSLSRIDVSPPPPAVLDVRGKPVRLGVPYHVLTTFRPQSGLGLGPNRNYSRCPLSVVQTPLLSDGIPVYFHYIYPTSPKERLLRTLRPHEIMFNFTSACGIGLWQRGDLDKSVGKYFITAGVRPGSTGFSDFRVGRAGVGSNSYKLYSCYLPCTTCTKPVCKDIGVHMDKDGFGRLAVSDDHAHTLCLGKHELINGAY
ncbi:hypothetical protein Syun_026386 [Stephania yunnanensis]|uniref:Uncharacterized protein n=1 Tax=Stephania yunnanensis TaxID=152371 RepID=A0AAP0EU67_9MAGN